MLAVIKAGKQLACDGNCCYKSTLISYFSDVLLQISSMLLFVKHYKQEVLGVGEVALPGEGGALREAAIQRTAKEAKDRSNSDKKGALEVHGSTNSSAASVTGSTNGTDDGTKTEYVSKDRQETKAGTHGSPLSLRKGFLFLSPSQWILDP